jgi:metal-responsive CopG/Arc/MetJ family transcriptional regulator
MLLGEDMAATVKKGRPSKAKSARASVSFPPELYDTLERIAKEKKVSVAWVVRDAAEKYVSDQWPLLKERQ